jgi:hypothetical protein
MSVAVSERGRPPRRGDGTGRMHRGGRIAAGRAAIRTNGVIYPVYPLPICQIVGADRIGPTLSLDTMLLISP